MATGAGTSFPAPLYVTWFNEFSKKYPNVQINYQVIGSGAGIEEFTKGKVDFGASDNAMTNKILDFFNKSEIWYTRFKKLYKKTAKNYTKALHLFNYLTYSKNINNTGLQK